MERHPQAAGNNEEQDTHDLNASQDSMPARLLHSKPIADERDSQQQRDWSGNDVRVKRPLIAAEEIRFSIQQKFRRKIRREVIAIVGNNGNRDSHDQQAQKQFQDLPESFYVRVEVWRHMSNSALVAGVGGEFVILAFATWVDPSGLQASALLCALVPTANYGAKAVFPTGRTRRRSAAASNSSRAS